MEHKGGLSSPPLAELGAAVDGREGAGGPGHYVEECSRSQQQRRVRGGNGPLGGLGTQRLTNGKS